MSTQSIIHSTVESLGNNADEVLISMANKYLLKNNFGIGKNYDRDDFKKICFIKRILCEENCRLNDLVNKTKEKLNLLILKYK